MAGLFDHAEGAVSYREYRETDYVYVAGCEQSDDTQRGPNHDCSPMTIDLVLRFRPSLGNRDASDGKFRKGGF